MSCSQGCLLLVFARATDRFGQFGKVRGERLILEEGSSYIADAERGRASNPQRREEKPDEIGRDEITVR
jgi:hypothetical protein